MSDPAQGDDVPEPRFYRQLADWWPLLSAVEDYAEEAGFYGDTLIGAGTRPAATLLELGSGGGNNAWFLKRRFQATTLVEPAPGMLALSRGLNPDCEHVQGDMRTLRLERLFDRVFVHDAIVYMTSEADLKAAMDTVYRHCAPGGAALLAPDYVKENFSPDTECGGHDSSDGRALRYLEWSFDPDPNDSLYTVDYALLLRDGNGETRVEHDRHIEGLFPRDTWLRLLREVGFEPEVMPFVHSELEPGAHEVFVAVKA